MNNIEIYKDIKVLFSAHGLGTVTEPLLSVSGGLMHKMYKVTTNENTYAVKHLNPSIMERDRVIENMIYSELIANTFSNYLPVVAALNFNGSPLLHIHHKYYMVFHWLEGTSIFPPSISETNCSEIGSILGKIHQLNISIPGIKKGNIESTVAQWHYYYGLGVEQNAAWIDVYHRVIDKLTVWTNQANDANLRLSETMVISHRDLDPKNVMWNHGKPYFIDWEAAGYVNPYQELLEVLNYWSDNGHGELDKDKFNALLKAYQNSARTQPANWEDVLCSGYSGMLGWLEYSLKRALGIESKDKAEKELGAEQITGTIAALEKYDSQRTIIKNWLCK